MNRYAACVEYCGQNYCGWQRQSHCTTVQECVEIALSKVADEPITIIAAGRTDSGVHAIGQTIHFESYANRSIDSWLLGANTYLPDDISLIWVRPVPPDFHARFKAIRRSYRYVILNRKISPSYLHGRVAWYHQTMDLQAMEKASEILLGEHDFSAFRASKCQSKSPVKTIEMISVSGSGNWIWFDITAGGFLHHMVRNIVGTLMRIGTGQESAEWMRIVLESRDRTQSGVTAVADGLYFLSAEYDQKYELPAPPEPCQFW